MQANICTIRKRVDKVYGDVTFDGDGFDTTTKNLVEKLCEEDDWTIYHKSSTETKNMIETIYILVKENESDIKEPLLLG